MSNGGHLKERCLQLLCTQERNVLSPKNKAFPGWRREPAKLRAAETGDISASELSLSFLLNALNKGQETV